ncbi:hypothetical protein B0H13DRAFT_1947162 [Mycena leptocephala]|nr:hypothetical protein B0H13DRAFT_1947162 [Mycena leptocephala]
MHSEEHPDAQAPHLEETIVTQQPRPTSPLTMHTFPEPNPTRAERAARAAQRTADVLCCPVWFPVCVCDFVYYMLCGDHVQQSPPGFCTACTRECVRCSWLIDPEQTDALEAAQWCRERTKKNSCERWMWRVLLAPCWIPCFTCAGCAFWCCELCCKRNNGNVRV